VDTVRQEMTVFKAASRKQLEHAKSLMDTAVEMLSRKLGGKADEESLVQLRQVREMRETTMSAREREGEESHDTCT